MCRYNYNIIYHVKIIYIIRYAKIPDEPMGSMVGMKGSSSSAATSSGSESSSESDDSEEERTQKLVALQQEVGNQTI